MSNNDEEMDFDFRDQIQRTDWYPLEIHHKNGALFQVDSSLDLTRVAKAIAQDDVIQVKKWLDDKKVYKPEEDAAKTWRADQYRVFASFIIVAPYVLFQPDLSN